MTEHELADAQRGLNSRSVSRAIAPLRGSVSERHAVRIAELEATVERMLANEAKLIADSVRDHGSLLMLADLLGAVREDMQQMERDLKAANSVTFAALADFREMPFWQRLRWLLTGRCE